MHTSPARHHRAALGRTSSVPQAPPAEDTEMFHVVFAPDDIRELTLEQLDDFYRLGVINENTRLWREGMDGWQTLGAAAGLTEAQSAAPSGTPPRRRPPPRTPPPSPRSRAGAARVTSQPPPAPSRRPPAVAPLPPPPAPAVSKPPVSSTNAVWPPSASNYPSVNPAPASAPSYAPASVPTAAVSRAPVTSTNSSWPPSVSHGGGAVAQATAARGIAAAHAPHPLAPAASVPASLAPTASPLPTSLAPTARESFDSNPFEKQKGNVRARIQSVVLWSCVVSGALVTLYRTDTLLRGAEALGFGATYLTLEQRWLGGAPTGTPRQVQALTGGQRQVGAQPPAAEALPSTIDDTTTVPNTGDGEAAPATEAHDAADDTSPASDAQADDSKADDSKGAESATTSSQSTTNRNAKRAVTTAAATRTQAKARTTQVKATTKEKASTAKEPDEPAPAPGTDEFLRMNMRNAVKRSDTKKAGEKAKKSGSGAYDPLNGDI